MLYFIFPSYSPNTASCNRMLAYLHGMSEMGVNVKVIYLLPDKNHSKIQDLLPGIDVVYCWEQNYINIRFLKNISYIVYLFKVYRQLSPGDKVYIYGDLDLLTLFAHKKSVKTYFEITEHPHVHPVSGRLLRFPESFFIRQVKKTNGIIVISTCLKQYFVERGIPEDKIEIVNSIVDFSRFDKLSKEKTEDYFAYCGNCNNKKDKVNDLIRAFGEVVKKHENIKLYIIGPQNIEESKIENHKLVHELKLEDKVIFTGSKSAKDVPQLLVNAKALFLTRPDTLQNRAGFSTKLGEYLASGNPVVAACVGDIPLFLKSSIDAYLYRPGSLESVIFYMNEIIEKPEESRRIGLNGKRAANLFFNANIETRKLIDFIKQ